MTAAALAGELHFPLFTILLEGVIRLAQFDVNEVDWERVSSSEKRSTTYAQNFE